MTVVHRVEVKTKLLSLRASRIDLDKYLRIPWDKLK